MPALIRGIGAAILVFLVAKGGMAVFTKGEATPNAYAVFFACFVGAVFSEDVWSWARSRQQAQLAGGAGRKSTADSKAQGDSAVGKSTKDHSRETETSKPS